MAGDRIFKIPNKLKRQEQHLKHKKLRENEKRDMRLKRRRLEDKNPGQREARQAKNVPKTLEMKRTWDAVDPEIAAEAGLGASVDVLNPKRRKLVEKVGFLFVLTEKPRKTVIRL